MHLELSKLFYYYSYWIVCWYYWLTSAICSFSYALCSYNSAICKFCLAISFFFFLSIWIFSSSFFTSFYRFWHSTFVFVYALVFSSCLSSYSIYCLCVLLSFFKISDSVLRNFISDYKSFINFSLLVWLDGGLKSESVSLC